MSKTANIALTDEERELIAYGILVHEAARREDALAAALGVMGYEHMRLALGKAGLLAFLDKLEQHEDALKEVDE